MISFVRWKPCVPKCDRLSSQRNSNQAVLRSCLHEASIETNENGQLSTLPTPNTNTVSKSSRSGWWPQPFAVPVWESQSCQENSLCVPGKTWWQTKRGLDSLLKLLLHEAGNYRPFLWPSEMKIFYHPAALLKTWDYLFEVKIFKEIMPLPFLL
jgi:hypothetical protein